MSDRVIESSEHSFYQKRSEIKLHPEYEQASILFTRSEMISELVEALKDTNRTSDIQEHYHDRFFGNVERSIIDGFVECTRRVKDAMSLASKEAAVSRTTLGIALARGIVVPTNKTFLPEGELFVHDYPLALEIQTASDSDYSKIMSIPDPKYQGGNYNENSGVMYHNLGESRHVPLITIRKDSSKGHEENHAVNHLLISIYQSMLPKVQSNDNTTVHFDNNWGSLYGFNVYSAMRILEKSANSGVKIEDLVVTKRYKWALIDAMSAIKDELLADIVYSTSSSVIQLENVFKVKNYDTLGLFFWENDKLRQRFYEDREKLARDSTKSVINFQNFYSTWWRSITKNDGQIWEKRQKTFKLFLAQIPLTEWPKWTDDMSLFQKERDIFEKVLHTSDETLDCLKITKRWKTMGLSSEENKLLNESLHLRKRFESYVFDKSDNLIISGLYFYEYKSELILEILNKISGDRLEKYRTYYDLVSELKQITYAAEMNRSITLLEEVRDDVETSLEKLDLELEENSNFDEVIKKYKNIAISLTEKWQVDYIAESTDN